MTAAYSNYQSDDVLSLIKQESAHNEDFTIRRLFRKTRDEPTIFKTDDASGEIGTNSPDITKIVELSREHE